jgi:hypothetical protein
VTHVSCPGFTWSMMVAADRRDRPEISALLECVRLLSRELGWLEEQT